MPDTPNMPVSPPSPAVPKTDGFGSPAVRKPIPQPERRPHLFRGAAAVRGWSRYRSTIERWTLCGMDRMTTPKDPPLATENAVEVTCPYCRDLMRGTETRQRRRLR